MKIDELKNTLRAQGLRAAVWYSNDWDPDIFYLTRYGGSGWLIVPVDENPTLIVPLMEQEKAQRSGLRVVANKKQGIVAVTEELNQVTTIGSSIGVVKSRMSLKVAEEIKSFRKRWVDISGLMEELRIIKTSKELEILKDGANETDKILKKVIHHWSEYTTEADVASQLEYWAGKKGCRVSFPTIVASGIHARMPHHETSLEKIQKGMCVIDFGIRYKGYCTDISRTMCVKKPSPEMEKVYYMVRDAQQAAIDALEPGKECRVIDAVSRESLGNYKKFFIHGLGHGIGVEVHEPPWINGKSIHSLREGMCLTIEPGVYTKIGGVRIEDDIHVTKKGYKLLTKASKDLIILD